ncbi:MULTISPECIES: hypothetical protein [Streptomyces]|uniref:hypothetical protein n=1 Tax=Streptomyces TaxID=1883 RepID=UPI00186AC3BE|nr:MULTISPECIES: hypothetical protein [Streptomyces]
MNDLASYRERKRIEQVYYRAHGMPVIEWEVGNRCRSYSTALSTHEVKTRISGL